MSLSLSSSSSSLLFDHQFFLPIKPYLPIMLVSGSLSSSTLKRCLKQQLNINVVKNLDFRLYSYRYPRDEDVVFHGNFNFNFEEAVFLFNSRDYYRCHDFLEALWNRAEEPTRTLLHGILQCSVGFHHLFNQNHRGAMMELGEGLCKLRKMNFRGGPFYQFEQEISASLDFIYQTQLELAACADDLCLTMDGSERSYQLLGSFAAGQHLYRLEIDSDHEDVPYIIFCPDIRSGTVPVDHKPPPLRVKLPTLHATQEHLWACM